MGSELGSKWMAWLVLREGGRVVGVWKMVKNCLSKLAISGYWVTSGLVVGVSGSRTRMWKKTLALSVWTIPRSWVGVIA